MSEDTYERDRYYELLWALRDLPEVPPPMVLISLGTIGTFPDDYNEGKRIQRERGLEIVPPKTECEIGAGFWHRVIKPVPAVAR
jgi:hypothetical protein